MANINEWKEFFDNHAPKYKDNVFVKNTEFEVQFIVDELNLSAPNRILDLGCGTGRHSIGLAKRGYKITGVDWSSGMLDEAKRESMQAGVSVEWVCEDAKKYRSAAPFDAALYLCEGSFGLILKGEDPKEHNRAILQTLYESLKPGAKTIFTVLNGLAKIRAAKQEDVISGKFDPITLVEEFIMPYDTSSGEVKEVAVHEQGFMPGELIALFREAGFIVENLWGGTAGSWKRELLNLDEMEIMVVARKPE